MCEICHQSPCHPQCPNADPPVPVTTCAWCDAEIQEGEKYYKIGDEDICEECVEACSTVAEYPEREDE